MCNKSQKTLQPDELRKRIFERLVPLDKMSFFERYAMFMGKAQIVEMGMKRLLRDRYGVTETALEKLTLGQAVFQLEEKGLRKDSIELLKTLVKYRNDLAHDFLAVDATGKSLVGPEFEHLSEKQLRYALYSVEEAIQVHDHLEEHGLW